MEDGILWVVNGAIRRQLDLRRQMLRQYRRTFGPAFYDHLRIIINFVPMQPGSAKSGTYGIVWVVWWGKSPEKPWQKKVGGP